MSAEFKVVNNHRDMPQLWVEVNGLTEMLYLIGVPEDRWQFVASTVSEMASKFYEHGVSVGENSVRTKIKQVLLIPPHD